MKTKTKQKRAKLAYDIMKNHMGESLTLKNWLTIINEGLTKKISLRNTKELAHMFRYISLKMEVNLEKEIILRCINGLRISNTYYKLSEGEI
jgi:hypothetical protein